MLETPVLVIATGTIKDRLSFFHEKKFHSKNKTYICLYFIVHFLEKEGSSIRHCAKESKCTQIWLLSRTIFCAKWKVIFSRAIYIF